MSERDFWIFGLSSEANFAEYRCVLTAMRRIGLPYGPVGQWIGRHLAKIGVADEVMVRGASEGPFDAYCGWGAPIPYDELAVREERSAIGSGRRVRVIQGPPLGVSSARAVVDDALPPEVVGASALRDRLLPKAKPLVVEGLWSVADPKGYCQVLIEAYSEQHPARLLPVFRSGPSNPVAPLGDLLHHPDLNTSLLYLAPFALSGERLATAQATGRAMAVLMSVVQRLRAPGGCPWDREQSHVSLQPFLLEETYELLEAIEKGDPVMLKEELGDVLLQVALHAVIAWEAGEFIPSDILHRLKDKMVSRHPHVFSDTNAETPQEVESNWERIKSDQKRDQSLLEGVPRALPALLQAEKIQSVASRVGFDWDTIEGPLIKIKEEVEEFQEAVKQGTMSGEEFGDILFSLVNVARFLHLSPETELLRTVTKFRRRFQGVERRARARGERLTDLTLADMDTMWNDEKQTE